MAEVVGFEPTVPFDTTHFKCVTLNHSDTLPNKTGLHTRIWTSASWSQTKCATRLRNTEICFFDRVEHLSVLWVQRLHFALNPIGFHIAGLFKVINLWLYMHLHGNTWQGIQESNLWPRNQNPMLYHLTNPQQTWRTVGDSNPWPQQWQCCDLTNWSNGAWNCAGYGSSLNFSYSTDGSRIVLLNYLKNLVAGVGFEPTMFLAYETGVVTRPYPQ